MNSKEVRRLLDSTVTLPLWPDTGEILNLKRNQTYKAASLGHIETMRYGRLHRVPTAWLKRKLGFDNQPERGKS